MKIPDFFIVGAPKCGTTALNDYLAQHPEVFVPPRKESHFFGSDLVFTRPRPTRQEYLRMFRDWKSEKRGGEASVWYLYSRLAAGEIRDFSPRAQILVMLRNPPDMMYSLHSQRLYNGTEDLEDFAEALAAEPARRHGRRLPRHYENTMGFFYRDAARYTEQVRRYFEVFGRDRVHVILFDDFRRDLPGVYRGVCSFLGVDPSFRARFEVVNPNKQPWSEGLRDFLRFASPAVRARVRAVLPTPRLRQALKDRVRALNTRHVRRPPMDPGLRPRLEEEFAGEIEALGRLLGRDLVSLWLRPAPAAVRTRETGSLSASP